MPLRSKILIQILNKLGICVSYDVLEKIDTGLTQRTIDVTGISRTPIHSAIESSVMCHGAMDDFDHNESTPSGIGTGHDTILMVFQNGLKSVGDQPKEISRKPLTSEGNKKSLESILPCQKLLKSGKFSARGSIPESFQLGPKKDFSTIMNRSATEHRHWVLARHLNSSSMQQQQQQQQQHHQQQQKQQYCIPSFSAMKSRLTLKHHNATKCTFTTIIPHPATDRDTIYTTMINFQDIFKQKSLDY